MKERERAYHETGYKCARCGQHNRKALNIDHINGDREDSRYENLIALCYSCHQQKTNEEGVDIEEVRELKAQLIYQTLTPYGVNMLKVAYRNELGAVVGVPSLVNHLVEIGLFQEAERPMEWNLDYTTDEGQNIKAKIPAQVIYTMTPRGLEFYETWKKWL